MLEFRLLGTLDAGERGSVALGGRKQRTLLAYMLLHRNKAIPRGTLIDALWPENPPVTAAHALDVYVSRLRKSLGGEGLLFETRGGSIRLHVPDEAVDAARFEQLVAAARRVEDPAGRLVALDQALALWRGRALADLLDELSLRPERERLEEERLVAEEERFEAMLALGRHDQAIGALQSLTSEHPLRERPQRLLMLALYRDGRQSEALELFNATRGRLREELGLEPGPDLRALQRRILNHDPTLAAPSPAEDTLLNLPAPPNELIGRERELSELVDLLLRGDVRLLVLAGAGGSGKTRLAIEAARQAAAAFANGAAFVPLAAVRDAELVPAAIADAVGLQPVLDQKVPVTWAAAFAGRELLLVVDNFEHVRSAAPLLVELLAQAPRLRLLVTSRVVLHLSGERVYPVQPLPLEDAAELFRQRTLAADPAAVFDAADSEAIESICARLDGLPLAVELAAGHARTLTPVEVSGRLDRHLPLLAGGARDLPTRQQTLRATLEWSYDLLNRAERKLFGRLSIFAAAAELEAIETVCESTMDILASLVDHNLVVRDVTPTGSRYVMLETVREFAGEMLDAAGDAAQLLDRHAYCFLELVERAERALRRGSEMGAWLARLEAAYPDLRKAIDRFRADQRPIEQARVVGGLGSFWFNRGYSTEVCVLVEEVLAAALPAEVRLKVLRSGFPVARHGDRERADEWAREALQLARAIGDAPAVVRALIQLGWNALDRDDLEAAEHWLSESVATARGSPDDQLNAAYPHALTHFARVATHKGEYERAQNLLEEALEAVGRDDVYARAAIAGFLARNAAAAGHHERAATLQRLSIEMFASQGTRAALPWATCALARTITRLGNPEAAARLIGAAEKEDRVLYGHTTIGTAWTIRTLSPREQAVYTDSVLETRDALGDRTFERLRDEGRCMTTAEMLRLVAVSTDAYDKADELRSRLRGTADRTRAG
jgi:predicted ATPase/DNA-binding SARP family transcriptional activator